MLGIGLGLINRVAIVTLFWKTDHIVTFSISRNTHFKYSMGCSSPIIVVIIVIVIVKGKKLHQLK